MHAQPCLPFFLFLQFPVLASECETDLVMLNTSVCKQGRYEMIFPPPPTDSIVLSLEMTCDDISLPYST